MKKILILVVIFFTAISAYAQKYKTEIPYTMVGDKMIVEMKINGTAQRLIFDTGGRTTISKQLFNELKLTVTDSMEVTDVNSNKSYYKLAALKSILTRENGINFTGFPALIAPEENPFKCFGAEGLIGNDILKGVIMTINHKSKIITLTSAETAPSISPRVLHNFSKNGSAPIIAVNIDNHIYQMLFDTGFGGLLSLKSADFIDSNLKVIDQTWAEGSFGFAGKAATSSSKRMYINSLTLGGAKFNEIVAETSTPPYTLIGMKILDYGKVTIDFPRGVLYFEAYEKINDIKNIPSDIAFKVEDGKLKVATLWGSFRGVVSSGDVVTHINGKPTRNDYDFCESVTIGIKELRAKKNNQLTINTKNGVKKIKYKR